MEAPELCIDTNVLVAYLKGREPGAEALERAIREHDCHVASVTVYELLFGVARAQRYIGEEALLGMMKVVPFDENAARRAAELHDALIRRNEDIGVKDVIIAAICLERALPLLTMNERHFTRVPGLTTITPAILLT